MKRLDSDDERIAELNKKFKIAELLERKSKRKNTLTFSQLTDESYSWHSLIVAVADGDFKRYEELSNEPLSSVYEFYLLNIAQNYEHFK